MTKRDKIFGGLWGAAVGDALGVPVEFQSRGDVQGDPVTGMRAYGSHHQPAGTWSDDSSLMFCTAESLLEPELNLRGMAKFFGRWYDEAYWTPHGAVFDVGNATADAIHRLLKMGADGNPEEAGGTGQYDNGNGSLMRILPVPLRFAGIAEAELLPIVHSVSRLTHGHPRSQMACGYYSLLVVKLMQGQGREEAVKEAQDQFQAYYIGTPWDKELGLFRTLLRGDIASIPEAEIGSGGYVMETLLASVWCLLTSQTYEECVLRAVNLGSDTDTTGCVAGGLAGVYYGLSAVPEHWRDELSRAADLARLFECFVHVCDN